ncbi:MAG: WG repeat-containing protein [Niabella sp.]
MKTKQLIIFFAFIMPFFFVQAQVVDVSPDPGDGIALSVFQNGYAKIYENNKPFFINTRGERFELVDAVYDWLGNGQSILEYEKELRENPNLLPKTVLQYRNKNGIGILSPKGEILLEAAYDTIDNRFREFWKLHKNGKISYFLPDQTLLPFFDDIGYLDGKYFDVQQNGKWHLYSKNDKRIVTKNAYDGFDYCDGCGSGSNYVYAQQNGKWGIIGWDEEPLVPFEYEHAHHQMRSDNWVCSFSKNGKPIIVHIPTQKEFAGGELLLGCLVKEKNGKFGAYNADSARLFIPFVYDKIELPNENSYLGYWGDYLITTQKNKKGVVNREGKTVLPNIYDEIAVYDDCFVVKKQNVSHLLDINGKELFQMPNGEITHVNNSFYSSGSGGVHVFKVKQKACFGLFFAESGMYVEPQFYEIGSLRSEKKNLLTGYVTAEKNGLITLFDTNGERILEDCSKIYDFYNAPDGFVSYKKNGKTGIYDLDNRKEILPPSYDNFEIWFSHGKPRIIKANVSDHPDDPFSAFYLTHHLYGLNGKKLTDFDAAKVDTLDNRLYLLKLKGNNGYALLDIDNRQTQRLDYADVYPVNSTRLLLVSHDNKTGKLYNIEEKKELKGEYGLSWKIKGSLPDEPNEQLSFLTFDNGMGMVYNQDGYGYIDEQGEIVIKPQYQWAFRFTEDATIVLKSTDRNQSARNFKMGVINKKGKYIFPMEYDFDNLELGFAESYFTGNLVKLAKQSGMQDLYDGIGYLYGLGDVKTGKILLPLEYDGMRNIVGGKYLLLHRKNHYGIATVNGEIVVPVEFEQIRFEPASYYNWFDASENFFPLLVYSEGKWRYINEDGTYLPIVGDAAVELQ